MEEYGINIIGYCSYCKNAVYEFESYRITNGKLFHNDDANNCYHQSRLYIDDFGDIDTNYYE